jgi:two-component system response regulator FixJ
MAERVNEGSGNGAEDQQDNTVFIVDDDADVRDSLGTLLVAAGFNVETYASARAFLGTDAHRRRGCLVVDVRMPDMDGLELQEELTRLKAKLPVIIMTGHGDVPLAASIKRAFDAGTARHNQAQAVEVVAARIGQLTGREREVLALVVAGRANKEIARELKISPRTVEIHRAHVMEKMEAESLAELVRITMRVTDLGAPTHLH